MIQNNDTLLNLEYLARKYDENNVPLYISYPTSSYWKKQVSAYDYMNDLKQIESPFLYVHFPFCDKVCHYCMCYKVNGLTEEEKQLYIKMINREIEIKSKLLYKKSISPVTNVHWGGGTPTLLSLAEMEAVFESIRSNFQVQVDNNSNISIEAFPDVKVITEKKIRLLSKMGFTEISYGIQDLDERVQSAINRECKYDDLKKIVTISKDNGLNVHIDLCYGLPFQELGEFKRTMDKIISLRPDRVAMLTYVHYPVIFENQRKIPQSSIPNSFMRVLLSKLAEDVFTSSGYKKIGFDHFALNENKLHNEYIKGNVCRDLMGYSIKERNSFIGIGSSAISFINNTFYHNVQNYKEYIAMMKSDKIPLDNKNACSLTDDDSIRNEIIQKNILTYGKIDKQIIQIKYGIEFDEYFKSEMNNLRIYEQDGLVKFTTPDCISLTDDGKKFCRHVAAVFDTYYRQNVKCA